ncbi:hypothetical protein GCM10008018_17760 [Paenibacillus marchantiophytorum]|uniref:DUF1080 domain-containing protein n=1 Tax=Paenibacillus marchantiophytorum TaxID=1619310 RepID=A0ABQ2BV38_9BACL|nr:glycosyl hydrolase family 98 C-terminal domain-containing protein [Paenibacillus marchantiophytorum]GGI46571.1 hypothetical protein GCM10008018_17760 [Paenibacillus marchantiophytorum]
MVKNCIIKVSMLMLSFILVFAVAVPLLAPVQTAHAAVPLRKVIDNNHPLFVMQVVMGPNTNGDPAFRRDNNKKWDVKQAWASVPDDVKPYVAFVLHPGHNSWMNTDDARKWVEDNMKEGKDLNIPLFVLFGESPTKDTSSLTGYAWLEQLFQKYPNMMGTAVSELTGVSGSIPSLLAMESQYGGFHIQSSMEDTDVFANKMQTKSYYDSVAMYKDNFIYSPKQIHKNINKMAGEAEGFWLSGAAGNWGPYYDSYAFYGCGAFGVNTNGGGKSEKCRRSVPENLYAMNMLDQYQMGATVYHFENQLDIPALNDAYTPLFSQSILPTMRYIIQHPAPSKAQVTSQIKVAYSASQGLMTALNDNDGGRAMLYEGLYENPPDYLNQQGLYYLPRTTGRYYVIPQFSASAPASALTPFANVLTKSSYESQFKTIPDKVAYMNSKYPATYTGDAFAQKVNNQWLVYNSKYTTNTYQNAFLPLSAGSAFKEIDFTDITPHSYALVEDGSTSLQVELNNYRTDHTQDLYVPGGDRGLDFTDYYEAYSFVPDPKDSSLRLDTIKVKTSNKPVLTISGYDQHYTYAESFDSAADVYTLSVNHNGPVHIQLDTVAGDGSGWTLADDGDANIIYTGTWTNSGAADDYQSTYRTSSAANASAQYKFFGTSVEWLGRTTSSGGTADVYIDGVLWAKDVSTSSAAPQSGQVLFSKTGLSNYTHTIKIVNKSGTIGVDRFSYAAAETPMPKALNLNDFSFATAESDQDNQLGSEHWTITNGNMKGEPWVGPWGADELVYNKKQKYADFTYELDVNTSIGTPVRAVFRGDPMAGTSYSLFLDPTNWNVFKDATNEQIKLYKDDHTLLAASTALTLATNTWYHIKIVATGSQIQCYINNTLVITKTDTSYSTGYTGVKINSNIGGKNDFVYFDNPKVTVNGTVSYSSDFSSWSTAADWVGDGAMVFPNWPVRTSFEFPWQWASTGNGTWAVQTDDTIRTSGESGIYTGTSNAGTTSQVSAGDANWSDYIYSSMVKFKTGSVYDASLRFRIQDTNNQYGLTLDGNSNRVKLSKQVGGTWSTISTANGITFAPEKWYNVAVRAIDDFISVSVNGVTVLQANDSTYKTGKVGLALYNGTAANFDDAWLAQLKVDTSVDVPLSSLSVTSGSSTITTNDGNLQMSAAQSPANATNSDFTWAVFESDAVTPTTKATIDGKGLLHALNNGTVSVAALSNDGSTIKAWKNIVISGQTVGNPIVAIDPVSVITVKDTLPALPSTVKVRYNNNTTGTANVVWNTVTSSQVALSTTPYANGQSQGKFTVSGTVTGTGLKATAYVVVTPKITGGLAVTQNVTHGVLTTTPYTYTTLTFDCGGGTTFNGISRLVWWDTYVNTSTMTAGQNITVQGTLDALPYQKVTITIHAN